MSVSRAFLGEGSFGRVYKRVDPEGTFAIKEGKEKHIIREHSILDYLKDRVDFATSNVIVMFGMSIEEVEGSRLGCLKLEFHEMTLDRYVTIQGGRLSLEKTARVVRELIKALIFLFRVGVIHADIKPPNVLITGDRVTLADFGNSILWDQVKSATYMQSRWYRSPEVILGIPATPAVDIWSLAVLISEIYVENIFIADSEKELVALHQTRLGRSYPDELLQKSSLSGLLQLQMSRAKNVEPLVNMIADRMEESDGDEIFSQKKQLFDLLDKMLEFSPERRIMPLAVLKHPFSSIREASLVHLDVIVLVSMPRFSGEILRTTLQETKKTKGCHCTIS